MNPDWLQSLLKEVPAFQRPDVSTLIRFICEAKKKNTHNVNFESKECGSHPHSLTAAEMHYGPTKRLHAFLPTSLPSVRFLSLYIHVCLYMCRYIYICTYMHIYAFCTYFLALKSHQERKKRFKTCSTGSNGQLLLLLGGSKAFVLAAS